MRRFWTALACAATLAGAQGALIALHPDIAHAQAASSGAPDPRSEGVLRQVIDQLQHGQPDYDRMGPELANATRQQLPQLQPALANLGKITEVKFVEHGPNGGDLFLVTFEHGATRWGIVLAADGKINGLVVGPAS